MRNRQILFGTALKELAELAASQPLPRVTGGNVKAADVDEAYVARLTDGIDRAARPLRVVVDGGNGAAGPLGLRALERAGVAASALFCEMDGRFPNHDPDPTVAANLTQLVSRVGAEQAHVGIAWDGDGDRLGVVDATGEIVWADRLLALFARGVLERAPGATVIADVKCSQALFADIARHGGRPIMWKSGHSLIKTKMREENAALAGEMSGHFFFADRYLGFDDGIYAALRLVELLRRTESTVLEALADLPPTFHTPELRVPCPDGVKFELVERVREALDGRGSLEHLDGVRITYRDGAWALVRASNTGPLLVLRFEAPTAARLGEVRLEVEAIVDAARRALLGKPEALLEK